MSLPPLGKPGLRRRRGHRCGWDSADRHAFTLHSSLHECTRKPAQYAGDGGIVISFRTVASWSRPRKDLSSKFRFRLTPRLGSAEPRSGPGHRPTVFPAHRVDAAERGSPCPSDHHSVEAAVTRRTHSSPSDTRNAPTQPVVLTRQRPRRADHQHTQITAFRKTDHSPTCKDEARLWHADRSGSGHGPPVGSTADRLCGLDLDLGLGVDRQ